MVTTMQLMKRNLVKIPASASAFEAAKVMRERGIGDRLLTGGGIIPQEDMDALATLGVGRLFGPGAATTELVDYIRTWFAERNPQPA